MYRRVACCRGLALYTLAALLLGACATPYVQPAGERSGFAVLQPDAAIMNDGYRLPYRSWQASAASRVLLLGVHGMNDYSHGFDSTGSYLARHGITMIAYDQRGFGETDGAGLWHGRQRLIDDLRSMILLLRQHYPGQPWYQPSSINPRQVQDMILNLGGGLLLTFVSGVLLGRYLPETRPFQRLMLNKAVSADEGYQASKPTDDLLGMTGIAETPLRPAGIGSFGDRRLNVVTHGDFIEKGDAIVIAETHGNRIVVDHKNT